MSGTSFEFGEHCPECGGLHWSKFRHKAAEMIDKYHSIFPHGAGYAFNHLEWALESAYRDGYKDGLNRKYGEVEK